MLLLTLAVVFPVFFSAPIVETDLWWHIATGREILASGAIPTVDPFSFTFEGREWISHEWLWDAVVWLAGPGSAYVTGVALPVAGGMAPGI